MGGEWTLVDAHNNVNGTLTNDVRRMFQTDDGAVIQVLETVSPTVVPISASPLRQEARSIPRSTRSWPSGTFAGSLLSIDA